jgi:hypothetical protein
VSTVPSAGLHAMGAPDVLASSRASCLHLGPPSSQEQVGSWWWQEARWAARGWDWSWLAAVRQGSFMRLGSCPLPSALELGL